MTEQERMLSGALYNAGDPALLEARQRAKCLCHRFNTQSPEDDAYAQHQQETLQALLGHMGTQCWIEAPFHCDYGTQITIGDHFFANYDCIFLDVAPIVIGNHVFLGPRVSLYTAGHPLTAQIRNLELEFWKAHHHWRQRLDRRGYHRAAGRYHRTGDGGSRRIPW